jgi:hypothetical protein
MRLYVIFGQRKERYEGELAPEALDVMDEYCNDDNPSWLPDKLALYRESGEYIDVDIFAIELTGNAQKVIRDKLMNTPLIMGDLINGK